MAQHNVLIFSHWRTGSNLLITIFKEYGKNYVDYNEYYSLTGLWKINSEHELIKISNEYLDSLIVHQVGNCTLKVNLHHYYLMDNKVPTNFPYKILLFRKDMFATVLSGIVARARWSFCAYRDHARRLQPLFNQSITAEDFTSYLEESLTFHEDFLDKHYHPGIVNHVASYEDDLRPYEKKHPTIMIPSNNVAVNNIQELKDIYKSYESRVEMIISRLDGIKSQVNKVSFEQYMDNILGNQ